MVAWSLLVTCMVMQIFRQLRTQQSFTVLTETHREAVENLIKLSSVQVIAQHAATFGSIAHAWHIVVFWTAKVHRAAKFGVFRCVLTPFRRFDTIWAN